MPRRRGSEPDGGGTRTPGLRPGCFEVRSIPKALRLTTIGDKQVGYALKYKIESSTQGFVDTVSDSLDERRGPLLPALEAFARERGIEVADLAATARLSDS